jgi:hypothetical protein
MAAKNLDDQKQEYKNNPNLKSSIVHKPFATGTVNFFNPHRQKSDNSDSQLIPQKLFLNAELEEQTNLPSAVSEIEYHDRPWLNAILSPWSVSAIAIIFFANLISGGVIWRNHHLTADRVGSSQPLTTLGSANLAQGEFVPINLGTLSRLKTAEDLAEESVVLTPINPALAPINLDNLEYHYVLTEYTGEQSLATARQKVPQVSLVNFPQGVFIYLGAFRDRDQAQEFVSQLKQAGFAAQVYPFD